MVAAVSLKCVGQGVGLHTFLFQNRKCRKCRRDRKRHQHAKTAQKNRKGSGLGVVALGGAVIFGSMIAGIPPPGITPGALISFRLMGVDGPNVAGLAFHTVLTLYAFNARAFTVLINSGAMWAVFKVLSGPVVVLK